ncbi:MAG: hypothetical protein EAX91_16140 [Candidatus Lokiarchaeota archaeon]|nr:hypothetical protein [Candidatus Lokiarchaeota archaeon]
MKILKIYKAITLLLLTNVIIILCINAIYIYDPQDSIGGVQDNFYQNELPNYEEFNFDSPKSSATLTAKTAYAIVVGISDYPGDTNDLNYCDDDSQDVYSMLIDDFNFKPENVYYFQDSDASKSAISNAFDLIASQVTSDDIFFFYYSGHGGAGTSSTGIQSCSVDSPHPYPNNYDHMWSIYRSGAAYMRVHFDRFEVEYDYDYVLLGDSDLGAGYYYEGYTGYSSGFWSGWIPLLSNNRLYVRLITDYSITEWGFSIDSYEAEAYDGTHFLCSYDSIPSTPSNYYMDTLLDSKLDAINCDEKYVVLDACNTGGMIPEVQDIGRYIMTACRDDEFSLESPSLQHGVFTNFFLQSFDSATDSNSDGVISMEESYSYTSSNAISYSGGMGYTHHPQQYDGISGESVLITSFGDLSMTPTGNSLSYSFHMYGTGLIEELNILVCSVSQTTNYTVEDLTDSAVSNTGFEYYSGSIQLSGATEITGYRIYARISGNEEIILEYAVSDDSDSDSLDDLTEIMAGLNASNPDSDYDGLNDSVEFYGPTDPLNCDTDGDGFMDGFEVLHSFNPLDSNDPPTDGDYDDDGLSDAEELEEGTDPFSSDTDSDGISDSDELLVFFTNPTNSDTDGDGMDDYYEIIFNLDPLVNDANLDPDNDGLINLLEYQSNTNPLLSDSDGDFMSDYYEYNCHLNPLLNDADQDYDNDGLSNLLEFLINSLADNIDSDYDLMPDAWEYNNGLDLSFNDANLDEDNDGLYNLNEFQAHTDPNSQDTDADGLFDGSEVFIYFTDPLNPDSDGDGYSDGIEVQWGADPLDPKISLNTFFFNIAGIAILVSSSYFAIRATLSNKKQRAQTKPVKEKLKLVKEPKVYNAVSVEKTFKPKPQPRPKPYTYSQRSYAPSYSRPSYPQSRPSYGSTNVDVKKIRDLILYGLPPPKSIYSAEGIKAQNIAALGFRYIDQGRFKDGFNNMFTALLLGVPEPMNSRIKTILLTSLNQFSSTSQPSTTIRKPTNSKKCSWCGKENRIANKFCENCGRSL